MRTKVVLTICNGADAGRRLVLHDNTDYILGRSPECALRFTTPETSRRHCRLAIALPHIQLVDLQSHNGTYVNGKRVGPDPRAADVPAKVNPEQLKAELAPGDRIEIGGTLMEVAVSNDESNRTSEPVAAGGDCRGE
jgi:pSer/pThr/pTyr-binding forkhead associated (FHA) protein